MSEKCEQRKKSFQKHFSAKIIGARTHDAAGCKIREISQELNSFVFYFAESNIAF